jgi:DNA-binding MurR/RpiR family transcriptional regulator
MFTNSLQATLRGEQASEISAIARLAADRRRRLWILGGRFSQMLAEILWAIVRQLRDRVELVPPLLSRRQEALVDVRRDHFVIAFDFRRYQSDTIVFAELAAQREPRSLWSRTVGCRQLRKLPTTSLPVTWKLLHRLTHSWPRWLSWKC